MGFGCKEDGGDKAGAGDGVPRLLDITERRERWNRGEEGCRGEIVEDLRIDEHEWCYIREGRWVRDAGDALERDT